MNSGHCFHASSAQIDLHLSRISFTFSSSWHHSHIKCTESALMNQQYTSIGFRKGETSTITHNHNINLMDFMAGLLADLYPKLF